MRHSLRSLVVALLLLAGCAQTQSAPDQSVFHRVPMDVIRMPREIAFAHAIDELEHGRAFRLAGIAKHYGTGSAVITRANVNNPAFKKYLYTP